MQNANSSLSTIIDAPNIRTTHIRPLTKADRHVLVANFKKCKFMFPLQISFKALYKGAILHQAGAPIHIPPLEGINAPDYKITGRHYELKTSMPNTREFANIPISSVIGITEDVIFKVKGSPLWCEGSKADAHYYLMLLQDASPSVYEGLKGKTYINTALIISDNESKDYLKAQKSMAADLEHIRSHSIKLDSYRQKIAKDTVKLSDTALFAKSQLTAHLDLCGGTNGIPNETKSVMFQLLATLDHASKGNFIMSGKEYYNAFRSSLAATGADSSFALDDDVNCPTPLMDSDFPLESFSTLSNRIISVIDSMAFKDTMTDPLDAAIPSFPFFVNPNTASIQRQGDKTKEHQLLQRVRLSLKGKNNRIPLNLLDEMIHSGLWKFDPSTREFIPTTISMDLPVLTKENVYEFTTTPETSKLIDDHIAKHPNYFVPEDEFITSEKLQQHSLPEYLLEDPSINLQHSEVVKRRSRLDIKGGLQKKADTMINGIFSKVEKAFSSNKDEFKNTLKDFISKSSLRYPPIEKITTVVGKLVTSKIREEILKTPTIAALISKHDNDFSIYYKAEVEGLSFASSFCKSATSIAVIRDYLRTTVPVIKQKITNSSADKKSTLEKILLKLEKILNNPTLSEISFIELYESISSLPIDLDYNPTQELITSATTSGATTAGQSKVITDLLKQFDNTEFGSQIQGILDREDKDSLTNLLAGIKITDGADSFNSTCEMVAQKMDGIIFGNFYLQIYSYCYFLLFRHVIDIYIEIGVKIFDTSDSNRLDKKVTVPLLEMAKNGLVEVVSFMWWANNPMFPLEYRHSYVIDPIQNAITYNVLAKKGTAESDLNVILSPTRQRVNYFYVLNCVLLGLKSARIAGRFCFIRIRHQ